MRIKPNPVLSFLLNPFGIRTTEIEFFGEELIFRGRPGRTIHSGRLIAPPAAGRALFWTTLRFQFDDGSSFALYGVDKKYGRAFSETVKAAWISFNAGLFEEYRSRVDAILAEIDKLKSPEHYPAACIFSPILEEAHALDRLLFSKIQTLALGEKGLSETRKIRDFIQNARALRNQAMARFEQTELANRQVFFDTFEKHPLSPEQRLSIIVDEDATLVLAGAGSGKTSVITAKATYLIEAGIRDPEQILLLAFTRDAAKEMSERVEMQCGKPLKARTIHALAYEIIGAVEGSKPALAAHATDDKAFSGLIKEILQSLVDTNSEVSQSITKWFSYARHEEKSEWEFEQKHDFYTYVEKADLRTLQGEQVKSFEELMIANWLYENGIEYEYEPDYEHNIPGTGTGRRNYCPDFRLKKSGVYIEHFGVRRNKVSDGSYALSTAPYVEHEEYLADMEWKREVHKSHKTTLLETFSYEHQENRLLEALAKKTAPFETPAPRSRKVLFDRIIKLNQFNGFVQVLGTFLRHFKGGGYTLEDCEAKVHLLNFGRRGMGFLSIFEPVYSAYQSRLDGRIDFEDMILRASKYVETDRYSSPFRHILVDEFQDISRSHGRLFKALKAQHQDGRIFGVGDDWQSIYRFTGSDIHLMGNFGNEFGGSFDRQSAVHRTVDLGRTFRSVDRIAYAAQNFVMKNPAQIAKTVIPAGKAKEAVIKIIPTLRQDANKTLMQILRDLSEKYTEENKRSSVLLLGRYKHVISTKLPNIRQQFPNLDFSFKTIHSSKGLEADHVILLNVSSGHMGFPTEIVDDPLLNLVLPVPESFKNAEERRVMYVAMTRARYTLTLIGSPIRPSVFFSELIRDLGDDLVSKNEEPKVEHICGECGGRLAGALTKNGRTRYKCEHVKLCRHSLPSCTECGSGLPQRDAAQTEARCICGTLFAICPECQDGWLVEYSSRYGKFLGCVRYPECNGKSNR